jgi:hypothetical protein
LTQKQQGINVFGQATAKLFQHALLGLGPWDWMLFQFQVVLKAGDDLAAVESKLVESFGEIEQVSALSTL